MKSYHSAPAVKDHYLARIKGHQEADSLIQGYGYWKDGKGCAVGCTLQQEADVECGPHGQYPIELGLPEWLAYLEDHLFERLPCEFARKFPYEFLESIPVGVPESAFSSLRDRFQIFWLERQKTQIDLEKYEQVGIAIDGVIALLSQSLAGTEPESAAWYAAEKFSRSAAFSAGWSAAWFDRSAAESAARSAALASARSDAKSAARCARQASSLDFPAEALVKREWLLAELRLLQPA